MSKPDIKELRQRLFSSLSDEEREEASRILRNYLTVCARIYDNSKIKDLLHRSPDKGDSTSRDEHV